MPQGCNYMSLSCSPRQRAVGEVCGACESGAHEKSGGWCGGEIRALVQPACDGWQPRTRPAPSPCPLEPTSGHGGPVVRGATKDMGKMLGGEEEKDPDAAKKEEERQEALRQEEEERKAKYAKMEAEREVMRQGIRDKYGIKKKEEREAEAQAAMEANAEGSLTRPKKAIPPGCGDEAEEEDESILDTVIKYLPGPLQDMFKK
ncbi:PREDICTED: complexin-1 [Chrysochloris asiatica]|uniref:Complexin-1 n=1 Tax=Chrysochloris asiatica TaxID=185453 RepID=A0A9B0X0T8_CHRAS|nr:PREDICTED: complexin-1 [Chrysochloris asiatica]